jgi:hypothetical protein
VELKVIAVMIVVFLIAGFLFKALQTDSHSLLGFKHPRHFEGKRKVEGKKTKRKAKS